MGYFNTTSNAGLAWYAGTSTIAAAGTFSVEGQSSTNQLLIRNIWIPNGASTDVYISISTGANSTTLVGSGYTSSFNSYFFIVAASTLTITLKNNSGASAVYGFDGVVLRV